MCDKEEELKEQGYFINSIDIEVDRCSGKCKLTFNCQ